ncbi:MAG: RraA family protein [Cytophagales bacterium]|nr:RraA family protein [Cytophagales bacterium]
MKNLFTTITVWLIIVNTICAQTFISDDLLKFYTEEWQGERMKDGRPKVSDDLLRRLKNISIEEVWGVLRNEGFHNQFEGGWEMLHEDEVFVGRALTAQYMPLRPDVNKRILDTGHKSGQIGASNSWPIDALQEGDVYVADCFGKVIDGTLIGDNLGNSIYARTKTGVIFDAGSRDLEGLAKIEGFNAFVRGWDPSFLQETMLTGINYPIRIGRATVFPGDAVLAKKEGVVFIPPHLLEKVVITAEFIGLKDSFGHQMLKSGVYTPGQIDGKWSDEIKEAFLKWIDSNPDKVPMGRAELDEFLKNRTW